MTMRSRPPHESSAAIGDKGERAALACYLKKGFSKVERNYRSRYGEIDIIVKNEEYLVFVEVKTRNTHSLTRPSEAVDRRKQHKLGKTAFSYMTKHPSMLQPRFDVAEVFYENGLFYVNIIENAFSLDVFYL